MFPRSGDVVVPLTEMNKLHSINKDELKTANILTENGIQSALDGHLNVDKLLMLNGNNKRRVSYQQSRENTVKMRNNNSRRISEPLYNIKHEINRSLHEIPRLCIKEFEIFWKVELAPHFGTMNDIYLKIFINRGLNDIRKLVIKRSELPKEMSGEHVRITLNAYANLINLNGEFVKILEDAGIIGYKNDFINIGIISMDILSRRIKSKRDLINIFNISNRNDAYNIDIVMDKLGIKDRNNKRQMSDIQESSYEVSVTYDIDDVKVRPKRPKRSHDKNISSVGNVQYGVIYEKPKYSVLILFGVTILMLIGCNVVFILNLFVFDLDGINQISFKYIVNLLYIMIELCGIFGYFEWNNYAIYVETATLSKQSNGFKYIIVKLCYCLVTLIMLYYVLHGLLIYFGSNVDAFKTLFTIVDENHIYIVSVIGIQLILGLVLLILMIVLSKKVRKIGYNMFNAVNTKPITSVSIDESEQETPYKCCDYLHLKIIIYCVLMIFLNVLMLYQPMLYTFYYIKKEKSNILNINSTKRDYYEFMYYKFDYLYTYILISINFTISISLLIVIVLLKRQFNFIEDIAKSYEDRALFNHSYKHKKKRIDVQNMNPQFSDAEVL